MNLGKAIRLCRVQLDVNQAWLAERAELSISYLSLLERGLRDPSLSTVERIADGLDVPLAVLLFLADDSGQLAGRAPELAEKLSFEALRLLKEEVREK